ncbi:MAG TPA: FtsX-like permease family protein, partial [Chryseolinea sp.]|nr:FtsX-like permease family protein [Chryseolinea sp.]
SVDSTFLSVFNYPVYAGTASQGLTPETIMISRDKALALFGNDRPIGEMITLKTADTTRTLIVSAILGHPSENSHLKFEALVAHSILKNSLRGGATYVVLHNQASVEELMEKVNKDAKLPGLIGEGKLHYSIEPLTNSYFNEINRMTYMRTRSLPFIRTAAIVCALILFMAAFNFASLYLLSLEERKKEAGIRKTLGVTLWRLVKSLTTEVILYIGIALMIAVGLMLVGLPYFNGILETSLSLDYIMHWDLVALAGGLVFLIGMLVVVFSLAQQHRVLPISLMKNTGSKVGFNRLLFTVQFVISITLAVCAVTIIRQMHYLETAPLGFNRHVVVLQVDKAQAPRLTALKNDLLQLPGVKHAAISNGSPVFGNWMVRYDLEDGKSYSPRLFSGDEDLMKTLDLQLMEGELPAANKPGKLVNEALVRMFDMKSPVGELIPGTKDPIIGVVKDFTATSFKDEIQPAIISYSTDNSRLLIDYSGATVAELVPAVEAAWKKIFPGEFFSYHLIQEELMKKYKDDTFLYKTVVSYSIVSMIISCFGLFALSWAVAQSRMKEVGIRKVLGASARDIAQLLTVSFVKRIVIAFLLAAPISYYLMNEWLQRFARKIPLDTFTFVYAAAAVTVVALATMSVQTLRAAWRSPVEELKNE